MTALPERSRLLVVMSTATVDPWLDEAVDSVLPQLEEGDRLLVRHDGVAPDRARPWTRHPRVSIEHATQRSGLAASLSVGVGSGDEPLVARLDSDDLALPGRFAAQRDYLDANPDVVVVGTNARRIDAGGMVLGHYSTRSGDRIRSRLLDGNPLIHSSVMFRRSAYESAGGYDTSLRHMEDYVLWLRMAHHGEVTVLPDVLVSYRIHERQITKNVGVLGTPLAVATREQFALGAVLGMRVLEVHRRRARWWAIQYGMTANSMLNRWRLGLASRARARG